jgi:hypothetical protein
MSDLTQFTIAETVSDTVRLGLTETVLDLDVLVNDRIDLPVEAFDWLHAVPMDGQPDGQLRPRSHRQAC